MYGYIDGDNEASMTSRARGKMPARPPKRKIEWVDPGSSDEGTIKENEVIDLSE